MTVGALAGASRAGIQRLRLPGLVGPRGGVALHQLGEGFNHLQRELPGSCGKSAGQPHRSQQDHDESGWQNPCEGSSH